MAKKEYWIDADGYLVYGLREKNIWDSVAEIPQEHIEPLCQILYTAPDLLEACKIALELIKWAYGTSKEQAPHIDQIKTIERAIAKAETS